MNSVQKKNKVKVFIPHKASLSTAITIIGQKYFFLFFSFSFPPFLFLFSPFSPPFSLFHREEDLTSAVAEMEAILAPKRKNEVYFFSFSFFPSLLFFYFFSSFFYFFLSFFILFPFLISSPFSSPFFILGYGERKSSSPP